MLPTHFHLVGSYSVWPHSISGNLAHGNVHAGIVDKLELVKTDATFVPFLKLT